MGGHGMSHGDGPQATTVDPQTGIRAPSTQPYDLEWVSDTPGLLALNYLKGMGAQAQNPSKMIRFGTKAPPGFAGVL